MTINIPNCSCWVVHILSEGNITEFSSQRFVDWDLVEVIHILVNATIALARIDNLDLLQYLNDNLGIHDCVWLFVCKFASKQEASLTKLIDESSEWQSRVHVLFDLSQFSKSLNNLLEKDFIFI